MGVYRRKKKKQMWQLQHVELNDGEALQSNLTSSMINHQQMQTFSVFKPTDLCGSYRIIFGGMLDLCFLHKS